MRFKSSLYVLILYLSTNIFGQLLHEHEQTPALGFKGTTRCYDQYNRPQRCIPEFENAAFNMEMEATNTCGEEMPQEYCVQTGQQTGGIKKSCTLCTPGQHHARFLTDLHNTDKPTWWQSETMLEGIQWPTQVNLTLRFGKAFDLTYIRLWFQSPRPESFFISKKTTPDGEWIPYQYYSATCRDTYGLPDMTQTYVIAGEETRALCTSEYSDISPLRGGNVAFGTLEGRPSAYNFDTSPELQEWVTASEIRITLDRINTFGDEVFGDSQVLKSYFYAVADVAVGARCKCNGHASECVASTGANGTRTRVCRCEHNTAGPDCGECLPFYNDAPWARANANNPNPCKECNCNGFSDRCMFDAKLYEKTGHGGYCLDCRDNRDGPNCETCRPNYYKTPAGTCEACHCDDQGSLFQQCNSEGKCQCKPGVTGEKCDRCAENHWDFTSTGCKSCGCSEEGGAYNKAVCDPRTGVCACKENVEGKQCKDCKPGFFHLDLENEFGCTPCFCYGHSSKCDSASGYSRYTLESSFAKGAEKWRAEDHNGRNVPIKYEAISQSIGVQAQDDEYVYFIAPDRFLGDQRASYNQLMEFTFRIGEANSKATTATDIILEGNGKRITNIIFAQDNVAPSIVSHTYKFRLHEHPDFLWQPRLNSRDFISLLTNLTAIKIKGTYTPRGVGFLEDFKMETAIGGAAGQPALWMEFCDCPQGYVGQFCESCAPGFRHSPAHGGPWNSCIPCDCNNHASICDPETGRCICEHHTAGENCELCARGYYGNALAGTPQDCAACDCPDSGACIQLDEEVIMCTECPTGYSGHRCDICSDGYYGDPTGRFGAPAPCKICDCNQNIDTNAIGNCNTTTGECLRCIHNTGGSRCEVCLSGFYGNALLLPKGDCKPCECDRLGSDLDERHEPICDPSTGACSCKERVTGRNCDRCEEGFYNLQSGEGCQSCNCDPTGSFNQSCDVFSGQCYCRAGVTGLRCDHCEARKYGFSLEGCKECECDSVGSKDLQCEPSGQCPCLDNVEGRKCDRCKENKFDRHRGCIDCPDCYNLVQTAHHAHNDRLDRLDEILNEVERRPTVIADEDFPVELDKLQDDIDGFYNKVRSATGKDSIMSQIQDIQKRGSEINKTLETVNETLEGVKVNTDDANRAHAYAEELLETIDSNLGELRSTFEASAEKTLASALERSKQAGQQSDNMTRIAQETREIADKLERQSEVIVSNAKDAKNMSTEVYELAKKANTDQSAIKDKVHQLKADVDRAEDRLNKTLDFTAEVNERAREVKNAALELLNEANNFYVPRVDVPGLAARSDRVRQEARALKSRADVLTDKSKQLADLIDAKNDHGDRLLERAYLQQDSLTDLVVDIHEANATVVETVAKWQEKLNEAERIYKDLKSSDSDTQKLREEAEAALKTIPEIERIIRETWMKTGEAQKELSALGDTANEALGKALQAKGKEEEASKELKQLMEEATDLQAKAADLLTEDSEMARRVDTSEQKLNELLSKPLSDDKLVEKAKGKVGQAVQETNKVNAEVETLLDNVKDIISELENTPDIDENTLDKLDNEIAEIERRINETRMEEKLAKLRENDKVRKSQIEDYKVRIEEMQRDVDNIQHIVEALPEGCFKRLVLEP
ncbi:laminin subunit gamma-1-like [Anthonomus grandis grandis]|uniref:laminin subunit gamma-1-like n=1 Tax=Anthonomus grandis grandis TaxID=2921223 RepID=UPI0021661900|nr:laminin subunit gamma-1-like [Anthonomus grandis grandis]